MRAIRDVHARHDPAPPGVRPLVIAVLVAVAVGLVVALLSVVRFAELRDVALAANPAQGEDGVSSTLRSRIGVSAAVAIVWPLLLRRLLRGSTRVYARIQRVSGITAIVLLAVLFLGAAPGWLHALQAVQALAQLAVFGTTLRPSLRRWYATHREPPDCPGAWRPILLLAVLAPLIAEVTIGNLPFSGIGALAALFTVPIYSAGALLVREAVRRTGGGWPAILLSGLAYCLVEEGLGLQSLFSPTMYDGVGPELGARIAGINGAYLLLQLVNHAVWSIAVPIALTELVFPETRAARWLGRPGMIITGVIYLAGAGLMLLIHLQQDPGFFAPLPYLIGTGVITVVLAVAALVVPQRFTARAPRTGAVPGPTTLAALGFLASFAFLAVLNLSGRVGLMHGLGAPAVLLVAIALVAAIGIPVSRWAVHPLWSDVHLLALCGGSVLGHSAMWGLVLPRDVVTGVGVIVLFALSAALLLALRRRLPTPPASAVRPGAGTSSAIPGTRI